MSFCACLNEQLKREIEGTTFLTERSRVRSTLRTQPKILVFDVDGVLVDVRGTYWRSALETVRHLSGRRVTYADLHRWKAKPGYNDDWRMTADWVTSLGTPTTYEQARAAFNGFYWGTAEKRGNVWNEKLLITPRQIT